MRGEIRLDAQFSQPVRQITSMSVAGAQALFIWGSPGTYGLDSTTVRAQPCRARLSPYCSRPSCSPASTMIASARWS